MPAFRINNQDASQRRLYSPIKINIAKRKSYG
jgi:hypothetical protein